jgi:uncharacterized membrane protein YcaP (DUF421 family)
MGILEMILRTTVVFIVLYLWCRILGKKLISQVTFFDFVAGITLGTISGSIMFSPNISLITGLAGLSLFALFALILDVSALKSFRARKLINSEPTLLIKNGKILEEGMKKTRLTMDDLLFLLRKKNILYVDQVDIAFLETDGTVSAFKKSENMPVTRKDLQVFAPTRGLPQTFIIDGNILENSLSAMNKDKTWVTSILQSQGISDVDQVAFAQIDQNNQVYIDKRNDTLH